MPDDVPVPPPPSAPDRGSDRRRRPTPMLSRFLLVGRRAGGRREGERERIYVDRPGALAIAGFVALTALSAADAWLTLDAIDRGGREANPVMRAALDLGTPAFVIVKSLVTVAGGAFLALHRTWRLGRACLAIAIVGYLGVTAWHLYGQWWVLPK